LAHQRILKSEFFTDYDVAQMPPLHRLFFQGLWCQADRNGTVEDKPRQLKARIMPYDDVDPEVVVDELVARAFVVRFKVDGKAYLSIRTWKKNQSINKNEKHSELPDVTKATEIVAPPLLRKDVHDSCTTAARQLEALPVPAPSPVPAPVLIPSPHPGLRPPKTVEQSVRVEKPKTERRTWGSTEFQRWAQYLRQQEGHVPEDPVPIAEVERWWGLVMEWSGGDVQLVCEAFVRFGQDPYWEGQGFPFRGFISQWKKFSRKEPKHAAG
jgi:hypothetical protein